MLFKRVICRWWWWWWWWCCICGVGLYHHDYY